MHEPILKTILVLAVGFCIGILGYLSEAPFDWGGYYSLIATLTVLFYFEIPEKMYDDLKELREKEKHFLVLVILTLSSIGLLGVWLAIRQIGFLVMKLLFEEGYNYGVGSIFGILTFVLATNLCFTIYRTLKDLTEPKEVPVKGLIDVTIQTVIIGLISVLPRYSDKFLYDTIGSFNNFVILVTSMVATLVVLLSTRKFLL